MTDAGEKFTDKIFTSREIDFSRLKYLALLYYSNHYSIWQFHKGRGREWGTNWMIPKVPSSVLIPAIFSQLRTYILLVVVM